MGSHASHELYIPEDCLVTSSVGLDEEEESRRLRLEALQDHVEILALQPNET